MRKTVLLIACIFVSVSALFAQTGESNVSSSAKNAPVFVENKGQWPQEVLFLSRMNGLDAWITKSGVVYDYYTMSPGMRMEQNTETTRSGHVVRVNYSGAAEAPDAEGMETQPAYYNYLLGADQSKWAANVRTFASVQVNDIYKAIDVRYYFQEGQLRYDFIVHPGGDPARIQLNIEGTQSVAVDERGDLVFPTRFGLVNQGKLFAYQHSGAGQVRVESAFNVNERLVGFAIGSYDHNADLIIDPLVWSTFIGGTAVDQMQSIAIDANGNVCMAGLCAATSYPTTVGAYDQSYNGGAYDVIASKLDPNGANLIFSTYIGGTNHDQANAVKVDATGNFYIGGYTHSTDYPTTPGAYDQTHNGGTQDAFVTVLNAAGTAFVYSTFLGGTAQDYCNGLALDASQNVYITGHTASTDYPVTAGAYDQLHNSGIFDICVTKLNASGNALVYSTFMGGASGDYGGAIAVDAAGCAYFTGYTTSVVFPTTAGAYSQTYQGGASEGFVAKLNATGTALVYSTHLGGASDDRLQAIAVDASGNAHVAGYAYVSATPYPTTAGAYDQSFNGGTCDIVVTKLNAAGSALLFSSYIGGSGNDFATALALETGGSVLVSGYVASSNYPTTAGAYDVSYNGGAYDVPVSRLSSTGATLEYSTYIGGAADEYGTAITSSGGYTFVTGSTGSSAFPTTVGAYDQSFNSGADVFVAKMGTCTPPTVSVSSNSPVCAGQSINLVSGGGTTYAWTGPNAFSSSAQNPTISGATFANSGTYTVTVYNALGCANTATVSVSVGPNAAASASSPICAGQTLNLSSSGGVSYSWSGPNSFTSAAQNPSIAAATTAASGTYSVQVTDGNSCTATATVSVTVNPSPTATATSNAPICAGQNLQLTSGSVAGAVYSWSGPGSYSSSQQNPMIVAATTANSGAYTVTVTTVNGCSATATVNAVVNALPSATASSNGPLCAGQTLNLTAAGGSTYTWSGPNSYSSTAQNPSLTNVTTAQSGTYSVIVTNAASCSSTATVSVTVNALPLVTLSSNSPLCANQILQFSASGGGTYAWSGPSSFSSTQQNPSVPGVTPANSGTYSLVVTGANGCTSSGTVAVVVNTLPSPSLTSNTPVCAGDVLNLNAGGGVSYQWSGPNGFTSTQQNNSIPNATAAEAGTYAVTVTNANGCSAAAIVSVVVNALPNATASSNSPVCEGAPLNFTSSGGGTYSWSGPAGFSSTQQNPTVSMSSSTDAGQYTVTVTNAQGCSAVATCSVVIELAPAASANAGAGVCEGQNVSLTSGGGVSYSWAGPNGFTDAQQNLVLSNVAAADAGTYTVTVTGNNGCTDTATAQVIVYATPVATATENGPLCQGSMLQLVANGGITYQWNGPAGFSSPAQNPSITNVTTAEAGNYQVVVTDANGCSDSATVTVVVNVVDTSVSEVNGGTLVANANGAAYQWIDCATGQPVPAAINQSFIPAQNGIYAVVVTENGCTDTSACRVYISTSANTGPGEMNPLVYPNPSTGSVNIVLHNPGTTVLNVFDVTGQLVQRETVTNASLYTMELNQSAGVYTLEIVSEQQSTRVKLIIE